MGYELYDLKNSLETALDNINDAIYNAESLEDYEDECEELNNEVAELKNQLSILEEQNTKYFKDAFKNYLIMELLKIDDDAILSNINEIITNFNNKGLTFEQVEE